MRVFCEILIALALAFCFACAGLAAYDFTRGDIKGFAWDVALAIYNGAQALFLALILGPRKN